MLRILQEGPEGCSCQVGWLFGRCCCCICCAAAQGPFAACFLPRTLLRVALMFLSLILRLAMLLP